jgi:hypothetical protein
VRNVRSVNLRSNNREEREREMVAVEQSDNFIIFHIKTSFIHNSDRST